jgi:conjugal transfer pilus assembly protein TraB
MSTNTQRNLTGVTTANGVAGVAQAPLTDSQIAQATLGTGISNASSMLADYYIKRAEQYQPVIEMPTGLQVELVFLDGFRFTTKDSPQ